jgi:pimeloyl-ACP methyl ester carboxylesterase
VPTRRATRAAVERLATGDRRDRRAARRRRGRGRERERERERGSEPTVVEPAPNAPSDPDASLDVASSGPPAPAPDLPPGLHALVFTRPQAEQPVNYLLFLPRGSGAGGARWPVIFYLHGKSLCGDDPQTLTKYGPPRVVSRDPAFPFVVVAPQCRAGKRWTDVDTLDALLADVLARYPVDPDRVYLTGYSLGAGGAWRFGGAKPERFAAIAAIAGVEEPGSVKGLARVPVWAFHGTDDTDIPPTASQAMADAIRAAGGDVRLELVPGRGHDITDVYDRKDLYSWFLEHRRRR